MEKISIEHGGTSNTIKMVSQFLQGHLHPYLSGLVRDLSTIKDERVDAVLRAYFGGEFPK